MVEFVSYNGKFPNLCRGTLVIKVNGKEFALKNYLCSGGQFWLDAKCNVHVETGDWRLSQLPNNLEPYREEIFKVVNENVPHGHYGGCI